MNIGLIGLGAMGSGIASSIARSGVNLRVYDLDKGNLNAAINDPLIHESTADVIIKECELTLFCVPSALQIDELLSKASPKPGSTVIDLTSSDPRITHKRAERLLAQCNTYHLDAAMSGGAKGAAAGTLTLMVGGKHHILESYRHILSTFANKIFHIGDAGLDLYIIEDINFLPGETKAIKLGIACEPKDGRSYYLMPRSSISKTPLRMSNSIGLIDGGYRGEIMAYCDNIKDYNFSLKKGQRLFQLVAHDCSQISFQLKDHLSVTSRGDKGFGSTGK